MSSLSLPLFLRYYELYYSWLSKLGRALSQTWLGMLCETSLSLASSPPCIMYVSCLLSFLVPKKYVQLSVLHLEAGEILTQCASVLLCTCDVSRVSFNLFTHQTNFEPFCFKATPEFGQQFPNLGSLFQKENTNEKKFWFPKLGETFLTIHSS